MKALILLLLLLPAAALAQDFARVEQELMDEINARRAEKRRAPLTYDVKYQDATDKWALRMATKLEHATHFNYYGEVIGNFLVQDLIIEQFFQSPGHKAVLMDKEAKRVCISVYVTAPKKYIEKGWTVDQPTLYNVVIRTY